MARLVAVKRASSNRAEVTCTHASFQSFGVADKSDPNSGDEMRTAACHPKEFASHILHTYCNKVISKNSALHAVLYGEGAEIRRQKETEMCFF